MGVSEAGAQRGARGAGRPAYSIVLNIVAQGLSGVATLLLARSLEAEVFGSYMTVYGVAIALSTLIDFGSSQARVREFTRTPNFQEFIDWLVGRTVLSVICGALLALTVSAWMQALPVGSLMALSMQVCTYSLAIAAMGAVAAARGPVLSMLCLVVGNACYFAGCLLVPFVGVVAPAIGAAGSWLASAALGLVLLRAEFRDVSVRLVRTRIWHRAGPFGLSSVASATTYLDAPVLALAAGYSAAGSFSAVSRWTMPFLLLATSTAAHLTPSMVRAATWDSARAILRSARSYIMVGIGFLLLISLLSEQLVGLLLGDEYFESADILRILSLAATLAMPAPLIVSILQARDLERRSARVLLSGSLLRVVLIWLLALGLSGVGAALATLVASFWVTALLVVEYRAAAQ